MADAAKSVWPKEVGERRDVGANRVLALAMFTRIGIVVGTFGDQ